jgi:hypothetical protein
MKISLRMVLVALVALVAIGGLISTIPSGQQSTKELSKFESHQGQCNNENGVSLVIDFGISSKREPQSVCVKDFKGTGWQLFAAANISVAGTDEFPTGFVCRIADWPSTSVQPCTSTPTAAQGTWAYFVASADTGPNWLFSGQGAAMHKPKCGAVEGWRFVEPGEVGSQSLPRLAPATFGCH